MSVSPLLRKAGLTLHVLSSVGWLGSVLVYLALGVATVTTNDPRLVAAAYLAMDWAAWTVLVPLAATSLSTGLVQALCTPWGLFRHHWVIVKLTLTVVATIVLVAYTRTLDALAGVASRAPLTAADLDYLRTPTVVLHSGAALMLLVVATVLAIYKPAGLTRHGQRQRRQARPQVRTE